MRIIVSIFASIIWLSLAGCENASFSDSATKGIGADEDKKETSEQPAEPAESIQGEAASSEDAEPEMTIEGNEGDEKWADELIEEVGDLGGIDLSIPLPGVDLGYAFDTCQLFGDEVAESFHLIAGFLFLDGTDAGKVTAQSEDNRDITVTHPNLDGPKVFDEIDLVVYCGSEGDDDFTADNVGAIATIVFTGDGNDTVTHLDQYDRSWLIYLGGYGDDTLQVTNEIEELNTWMFNVEAVNQI